MLASYPLLVIRLYLKAWNRSWRLLDFHLPLLLRGGECLPTTCLKPPGTRFSRLNYLPLFRRCPRGRRRRRMLQALLDLCYPYLIHLRGTKPRCHLRTRCHSPRRPGIRDPQSKKAKRPKGTRTSRKMSRKRRKSKWWKAVRNRPLYRRDARLAPCQVWANPYLLDILSSSVTPLAVIAAATAGLLQGHRTSHLSHPAHALPIHDLRTLVLPATGVLSHPVHMMEVPALLDVRCLSQVLAAIFQCPPGTPSQQGVVAVPGQYHLICLHLSCSLGLQVDHVLEVTATLENPSPSQVMTKNIRMRKNR